MPEPPALPLAPYRSAPDALGTRLAVYHASRGSWMRRAAGGLFALWLALCASLCAVGTLPYEFAMGFSAVAFVVLFGLFAFAMLSGAWSLSRLRVEEHERGLVFFHGRARTELPWTALRKIVPWQRAAYAELVDTDGRHHALPPSLRDRGQLLLRAARVAEAEPCERALEQIHEGKTYEISSIEFTRDGLRWDTTGHESNPSGELAWAELRDVRVDWPELLLTPRGRRTYRFHLPYVTRWVLLLALVESLRPRNT